MQKLWSVAIVLAVLGFQVEGATTPTKLAIGKHAAAVATNILAKDSNDETGKVLLALALEFAPDDDNSILTSAMLKRGRPVPPVKTRTTKEQVIHAIVMRANTLRNTNKDLNECLTLYKVVERIQPDNRSAIAGLFWLKKNNVGGELQDLLKSYEKVGLKRVEPKTAQTEAEPGAAEAETAEDDAVNAEELPVAFSDEGFNFAVRYARRYKVSEEEANEKGTVLALAVFPLEEGLIIGSATSLINASATDDQGTALQSKSFEAPHFAEPKKGKLHDVQLILGKSHDDATKLSEVTFNYNACFATEYDIATFSIPPLGADTRLLDAKGGVLLDRIKKIKDRAQIILSVNVPEHLQDHQEFPWKYCIQMKAFDDAGNLIGRPTLYSIAVRLRGDKRISSRVTFIVDLEGKTLGEVKVRYLTDGIYKTIPVTLKDIPLTE